MPIDKNEITKEMIEKALQCKTTDELIALAKTKGKVEQKGACRVDSDRCRHFGDGNLGIGNK